MRYATKRAVIIKTCDIIAFYLRSIGFIVLVLASGLISVRAEALEPDEVLVIANRAVKHSFELAEFYLLQRKIPHDNLLLLDVTGDESCSREEYDQKIAIPIRRLLEHRADTAPAIRCLVLMQGVPLNISSPFDTVISGLKALEDMEFDAESKKEGAPSDDKEHSNFIMDAFENIERSLKTHHMRSETASVDSELMLVKAGSYPLEGWIPNPYFLGFQKIENLTPKENVLMVSRLDGPDAAVVRRMITDSIAAEKTGLKGTAYFDARWPLPQAKISNAYGLYDLAIHRAAQIVGRQGNFPVVINEEERLFQPGEGANAALYCGWYSLENYVDAFNWQPGAVGYHIASHECKTLREKDSRAWCKMMLEKGAAATIGPVSEPYITAFPFPDIFFSFLVDGYLTLAECYLVSTAYLSWKMVLIGDPLYRPFYRIRK